MGAIAGPAQPVPRAAHVPSGLAIEAHGLVKAYRGTVAVDDVDLRVEPGEVVGLLGPNGAGKTTVIRMLSTILDPDSGSFSIAGLPHTEPARIRRRIGVLPESAGYPPHQTCQEWLTLHARLFGATRPQAAARTDELLAEVGLGERRSSLIAGLSRGMRQRLGIARALLNDPPVLFLDEPTLGLDPLGQRQVLELVTRVAREHGVTVVLSTHVLDEVEQICDRVVILSRGRIVASGTVAEVARRAAAPRHGVVQVPAPLAEPALEALARLQLPARVVEAGPRSDVEVWLPADRAPEESAAGALRCLLEAGVPVLGFELEGGRLNDAFLAVTGEGPDD